MVRRRGLRNGTKDRRDVAPQRRTGRRAATPDRTAEPTRAAYWWARYIFICASLSSTGSPDTSTRAFLIAPVKAKGGV